MPSEIVKSIGFQKHHNLQQFRGAPHGILKSEKMQISTSKTAYGYFGKEWN